MHENLRWLATWLFRASVALFGLAWVLPILPEQSLFLPGAMAFLFAPFVAFGAWLTLIFEGFDFQTLAWAGLLSVVTVMNVFFMFAPFLRDAIEERAGLVSLMLGVAITAVLVLSGMAFDWQIPSEDVREWSVFIGPLAWLASFALMLASSVASHFAGALFSSFTSDARHD